MSEIRFTTKRLVVGLLSVAVTAVAPAARCLAADSGSVDLTSGGRVGDTQRVECQLVVGGDLKLATDGEIRRIPMSVVADVRYDERLLEIDPARNGRLGSVRYVDQADAVIKVDQGGTKPAVRDAIRLVMVQSELGGTTMFSPHGPLTRDELDMMDLPFGSLLVERLLPEGPVTVGQTWAHSANTMTSLMGLDAASQCDVESVLGEVTDVTATIALAGSIQGAIEGVATELELKGVYDFDRRCRRITRVELAVKENRAIGHVGPGLDVVAKLKMRIKPVDAADGLGSKRLAEAHLTGSGADQMGLLYESRRGGFRLTYDRRWYVTADEPRLAVFRFIDRGDLIAQCRVSPVAVKSPDRHITLEQFQKDIRYSLGDHFGQFVQATQWQDPNGGQVYRVRVNGEVKDLPIEWRYYLIAHASGHRVALAFTVEQSLAKRFGDADERLVETVTIVPAQTNDQLETAGRPAVVPGGNVR